MNSGFLKVVAQSSAVRLASAGILFALTILLVRSLGPKGFGAYSFAYSLIGIAVLIAQLGFPALTVREVAKFIKLGQTRLLSRYLAHATLTITAVSIVLVTVIAFTLLLFLQSEVSSWKVIVAGLPLVVLFPLVAQTAALLRGVGQVVQSIIGQQLFRPILLLLLVSGLLLVGGPVNAITVILLHGLAALIVLAELRFRARTEIPMLGRAARVSPARLLAWTSSAIMLSGEAVARLINTKFDIIAIGLLMDDAAVGVYAAGAQFSQTAAAMLLITAIIVQPAISRSSAVANEHEVERLCRQSAQMSFAVALIFLLLAALWGKLLIGLALGPEYGGVWTPLMVLIAGQVVNAFFGPVGVLLNMRGEERTTLSVTFAISLVNIGLNLALIPTWGLVGAASATAASIVVWNAILWVRAWQLWGINASALPWPHRIRRP